MGTTASAPQLSQEQADIKYLGSRYPFADDELVKLYRTFHRMQMLTDRTTFLTDLAVQCVQLRGKDDANPQPTGTGAHTHATSTIEDLRKERFMVMQVVESKILPPEFSDQLEKTNFGGQASMSNPIGSPDQDADQDAKLDRTAKLEQFFQGLANVGRRGGRPAIGVLFDYFAVKSESKEEQNGCPYGQTQQNVADCYQILALAHRLSLAAAFLGAEQKGEDMGQWIPPEKMDNSALKGMGLSLIDFVKRKRLRESPYGTIEPDPELDRGFVEKLDLQEFAETNLPVLSSSLSTFMFHVLFPEKQFPRELTAFQYPSLLADSVFFDTQTSPLLFSFAALSSSLGGSVSWLITEHFSS